MKTRKSSKIGTLNTTEDYRGSTTSLYQLGPKLSSAKLKLTGRTCIATPRPKHPTRDSKVNQKRRETAILIQTNLELKTLIQLKCKVWFNSKKTKTTLKTSMLWAYPVIDSNIQFHLTHKMTQISCLITSQPCQSHQLQILNSLLDRICWCIDRYSKTPRT
jgi:hypothetical protein